MTPATQQVVSTALDQALAAHIAHLYAVLAADNDETALARFWTGLNRTIGMHEEIKQTIEADDQCIAADSSGFSS